ncbi:MAG: DUF3598 family protein [Timaviella obliquedivisa GSE-PSE-MK23-08B]|nr:DUF3598 family protein [Timaviella obliquedivisa GSE-PSE-MK23-08B]
MVQPCFSNAKKGFIRLRVQHDETGRSTLCRYLRETPQSAALEFEIEGQVYQTLLLPDGASTTCPKQITGGTPSFERAVGCVRLSVSQRACPLPDSG